MSREDWERRDEVLELLNQARDILEEIVSDLDDRISNIEEYFSSSPVLEQLESRRDSIENAINSIEDAISELEEME